MQTITPVTNSLTIAPSLNQELSNTLGSLHGSLMDAAEQSANANFQGQGYTSLEMKALTMVEALRLLNGFELATVLERGRIIHQIDQEGLVGVFPGDYHTLEQIAQDIGISAPELSDTRALCEIVFPWIENNTGQTVAYWWDHIGKSKFREMVPVLRALIEGVAATDRGSVAQSVQALLQQEQVNAVANNEEDLDEEVLRMRAARQVLEFGQLPVREMRQQIRPVRTENLHGVRLTNANIGHQYIVLRINNNEQDLMLSRLLGTHVDMTTIATQDDRRLNGIVADMALLQL